MAKTDAVISEDISVFDMIAEWGAWAVVVGIAAEVAYAFAFRDTKSFLESWTPVAANALVALGIIVEIHFNRKSGERRDELDRRSNERVAEANARVAEAEKRVAEANLEIARLKARRTFTEKQRKDLATELARYRIDRAVVVPRWPNPEVVGLALELGAVLTDVFFNFWKYPYSNGKAEERLLVTDPQAFSGHISGVVITVVSGGEDARRFVQVLGICLEQYGISATTLLNRGDSGDADEALVSILVGEPEEIRDRPGMLKLTVNDIAELASLYPAGPKKGT